MSKTKSRVVRLYSYDSDATAWWMSDKAKTTWKRAQKLQQKTKKRQGKKILVHPTTSVRSFISLAAAKTVAKKVSKHWYYLTEYQVSLDTLASVFDGTVYHISSTITKVHPLVKVKT